MKTLSNPPIYSNRVGMEGGGNKGLYFQEIYQSFDSCSASAATRLSACGLK